MGCMGYCYYCYLQIMMGLKFYICMYVNVEEILDQVDEYMKEWVLEFIRFEVFCMFDIVGIDYLIYILKRVIEYFG